MLSAFGIIVILSVSTFVLFVLSLHALATDTELLPSFKRRLNFSRRQRVDFAEYFDEYMGLRD